MALFRYLHTYTHTHAYAHTHIYTHTHAYAHTYTRIRTHQGEDGEQPEDVFVNCIKRAADQLMGSHAYLREMPLVIVDGNSIVWRCVWFCAQQLLF